MKPAALMISILMTGVYGCNHHPYYETNKSYKKQVKAYAKIIRKQPGIFVTDQASPAYWVGTTNFNMRKPNFVIIHHTAQNSCDQTLKTFTLACTQVII